MRIQLLACLLGTAFSVAAQSPLTTLFAQNNGLGQGATMYFDVVVNVPITLQQIDVNVSNPLNTSGSLDVYWTPGSYVGNATNPGAWTLGGSGPVTAAGTNVPSPAPLAPFVLAPGSYGIAVVHNGVSPAYTNGNGTAVPGSGSNQTYSTAELTVLCGASAGGGLGTAICCEPRVINMSLSYLAGNPGNLATHVSYGTGCYDTRSSFYELFPPNSFDLSGSAPSSNSILMVPTGTGYVVLPGTGGWFTPVSPDLNLGDDVLSGPHTLLVPLTTPVRTTSQIWISSNGFVGTVATIGNGCCAGSAATLLAGGERFAPLWTDLNPSLTGSVHFDVDQATATAYVTWVSVPEYPSTASNTFQIAFQPAGTIEYRWQGCAVAAHDTLTGYSPGGGARLVPSIDLSASLPITTGPDRTPIVLTASARPLLGTTFQLRTTNIPAGTSVGASILSFTQLNPGLDLGGLGMPGCNQYVGLDVSFVFLVTGSTGSTPITMPTDPMFVGTHFYAQSATFTAGVNLLGALASNGVDLRAGTQ